MPRWELQDEPTHVNVQPSERWAQLFAAQGFFRDLDHDATYISPWAVLYHRADKTSVDVATSYEASWARLRAETLRQRRQLLELQGRLEEMRHGHTDTAAVEAELVGLRRDLAQLRAAIVAKDRDLGSALGRAAEMHAQIHRFAGVEDRLRDILGSRSWRLAWVFGRPFRALRRHRRG